MSFYASFDLAELYEYENWNIIAAYEVAVRVIRVDD